LLPEGLGPLFSPTTSWRGDAAAELVVDGIGVTTTEEPSGAVGRIEELTGVEELEANTFPASLALRARVASCIFLNFSWLLIISAKQTETNSLVKLLWIRLRQRKRAIHKK
jgi:hypothetical protein